jgi:hypothetical protein
MHWEKVSKYYLPNKFTEYGFLGHRSDGGVFTAIGQNESCLDRWLKADYKKSLETKSFVPIEE